MIAIIPIKSEFLFVVRLERFIQRAGPGSTGEAPSCYVAAQFLPVFRAVRNLFRDLRSTSSNMLLKVMRRGLWPTRLDLLALRPVGLGARSTSKLLLRRGSSWLLRRGGRCRAVASARIVIRLDRSHTWYHL